MQSNESALPVAVFGLRALFVSERGFAGGLMLYEIATDNAGLANAGAAARAQGPSTIASNPAGFKVPQTATLSLYQQLDSQWALLASVNWQDGSTFGDIGIDVDTSAAGARVATLDAHYKDTYQLALGAQYQMNPDLLWDFGIAYDSSAVSDSHRTLTVPMGAAWRFAAGLTYSRSKETDFNFSWVTVWMGDMSVDQQKSLAGDRTSGEFDNAWIQALSANMTWRY